MSSNALSVWIQSRAERLDFMEELHWRVGGGGRGRRFTTEQVNHTYVVVLSAEFQGFCRDLHDECSDHWVAAIPSQPVRLAVRDLCVRGRRLQHGNPNPSNVGSDFNRFGLVLWDEVRTQFAHGETWHDRLRSLTGWRNAVAHHDFSPANVGGVGSLTLRQVREWRSTCRGLARAFDRILRDHLADVTGNSPW
ncbi:hypothetical protein Pan216_14090 [Planctomycetes bacterium Pan216]|uniref:RiboL-PSP-HEPN domain-containing protein n=1 Tax=Kolteria novifilia TaxID=2527975 RepID=A0A518B0Q3_9BACT|nr:hypothetical protein Pan216_14090 [Planctomycetes bacterium Pan216]